MTDYVPTTENVRECYIDGANFHRPNEMGAQFDRWLAEHDKQVLGVAVDMSLLSDPIPTKENQMSTFTDRRITDHDSTDADYEGAGDGTADR